MSWKLVSCLFFKLMDVYVKKNVYYVYDIIFCFFGLDFMYLFFFYRFFYLCQYIVKKGVLSYGFCLDCCGLLYSDCYVE